MCSTRGCVSVTGNKRDIDTGQRGLATEFLMRSTCEWEEVAKVQIE
jgi:hypothetical protein